MIKEAVLGMALDAGDDDAIMHCQPLSAFIVVKALDEDGELCYLTGATEGLHSVECLGMAEYAAARLKRALADRHQGDD